MGKVFSVQIRKDCKVCGGELPKRFRVFCSKSCRWHDINQRNREYQKRWQQERRGAYTAGKKQCAVCGKWYVQVGTHVIQAHEYESAREYREDNVLPLKKGILPEWYREEKAKMALENGTFKNLKVGKLFWYQKGDERAKVVTGYKGRHAKPSEYY